MWREAVRTVRQPNKRTEAVRRDRKQVRRTVRRDRKQIKGS